MFDECRFEPGDHCERNDVSGFDLAEVPVGKEVVHFFIDDDDFSV